MSDAPERVWIYADREDDGERYLELIPEDAHSDTDVEYIRADLVTELRAENATLRARVVEVEAERDAARKIADHDKALWLAAEADAAALRAEVERLKDALTGIKRAGKARMRGKQGDDHAYYFHTADAALTGGAA